MAAWEKSIQEASEQYRAALENPEEDAGEEQQAPETTWGDWLKSFLGSGGMRSKVEQTQQCLQQLYEARSEFVNEDRTGFAWVYLQK